MRTLRLRGMSNWLLTARLLTARKRFKVDRRKRLSHKDTAADRE